MQKITYTTHTQSSTNIILRPKSKKTCQNAQENSFQTKKIHIQTNIKQNRYTHTLPDTKQNLYPTPYKTSTRHQTKPLPDTKLQTSKQPQPKYQITKPTHPLTNTYTTKTKPQKPRASQLNRHQKPISPNTKNYQTSSYRKEQESTLQRKHHLPQLSISSFEIICVVIDLFKLL